MRKHILIIGGIVVGFVLLLFLGLLIAFSVMSNSVRDDFFNEAVPIVHEMILPAFNMQTIAGGYLWGYEIDLIGVTVIAQNIQESDSIDDIFIYYMYLHEAIGIIYERMGDEEVAPHNREFFDTYHRIFIGQARLLTQAGYNERAAEFNGRLASGLGFLVRPFFNPLPRFDDWPLDN